MTIKVIPFLNQTLNNFSTPIKTNMKTAPYNIIKAVVLKVTFMASILLFASCDNNQKPEDTKVVAEEINEEKFDNSKKEKDAQFLVNVAEINLEQIQLGKLAQQRGKTAPIKELGKVMEAAHTKSLYELNALARNKMITIPISITDDAQEDYEDINKKSTNDFDKAYADMMVSKHRDAVDAFEEASKERNDADIKTWAAATLPDLQKHLDHSTVCQRRFDTMYLDKKL